MKEEGVILRRPDECERKRKGNDEKLCHNATTRTQTMRSAIRKWQPSKESSGAKRTNKMS